MSNPRHERDIEVAYQLAQDVADVVDRALICDSGDCIDPLCRMSRALRSALTSQGYSREWRTPSSTPSPPPMLIPIWYDWPTDDDREAGMCDDPDEPDRVRVLVSKGRPMRD